MLDTHNTSQVIEKDNLLRINSLMCNLTGNI